MMHSRYGAAHASKMQVMASTPPTRNAPLNLQLTQRSGGTATLLSLLKARIDSSGDVCVVIHQDGTYTRVDNRPPRDDRDLSRYSQWRSHMTDQNCGHDNKCHYSSS